jgi:NAD(P)-dependent dehydrogenase (short-subunit alcohol dehydrogenase family)
VRGNDRTELHDLADDHKGRVEIERLDICERDQIAAPHEHLFGRKFDILFVNAGVTNNPKETIPDVTTDEFVRVMVTNSLGPIRVVEAWTSSSRNRSSTG